jgi:hypothetical protein
MVDTGPLRISIRPAAVLAGRESRRSPGGTVRNAARPVADIASCGAALEPVGCGRQSAQSGSDHHQDAGRVAMGNAAFVSQGQRRHVSPNRGRHRARPLLCPYPLASGLHERPAYLYDRSVLRRSLGQLVGQQRRRFRPRFVRPCACRQLRTSRSQNSALRRGHPQPESAGSHRDLRYRSSQLRARRSIETPLASRVIDDSQLRCDLIFTEASQLGSRSRTVLRRRYWSTQRGTVKRTSAPCGARGATHKRPPWASTIDRQMASPMPSPSGFVVKKG